MSHILLREAAEHRRDSLHVAYRGQMTISGHEWGWAISLLRVFWGSNEINNLKDHHSKGNSIKQYKEMCKQNILLKNIDRMFLFIHTLRYWTVFHVIGCCCFWFQTLGESTMDVVMEVAFMPSTADFGFPWWTHLRITKASVLRGIMAYLDHPSQRPVEPGALENISMTKVWLRSQGRTSPTAYFAHSIKRAPGRLAH